MQGDATANVVMSDAMDIRSAEFLPLRGLAGVLMVLLATSVVLAAARLAVPLPHRGPAWQIEIDLGPLVVISRVSMAAAVIFFLIWFHRARINAERFDWRQRRARAWTFWGWIIPVASLWIPFQLMGDIWRAGLPPAQRSRTAWLPASWWVSWLLGMPPTYVQTGTTSARPQFPDGWVSLAFFAVAGLTLIAIVRAVSTGPIGSRAAENPA